MSDLYADAGRPGVLIVGGAHDLAALTEIVQAAGGWALMAADWTGLAGLPAAEPVRLMLVSTADIGEDVLVDALPVIARMVADRNTAIVVCLQESQIDIVASVLFGHDVDLLCSPDPATVAAAIALRLSRRDGLLSDTVREREAERLRQLNEEVARIADVLTRLTNNADHRPGSIADRGLGYRAPPPMSTPTVSAADVRRAIRARRLRDQQFPGLLEDPAWDMLLDLYAAELEGAQVSVSSLCIAAAVPATTALRWISRMTDAGLLERQADPFDRRRAFMVLSVEGRERMQRYFAALTQNGLQIA